MTSPEPVTVLVDMDGVVANLEKGFLDRFRKYYPDDPFVPLSERNGMYMLHQYKELRTDLWDKCLELFDMPGLFEEMEPIEGAIEGVLALANMEGVSVFFCTGVPGFSISALEHCFIDKFKWIKKHYGKEWEGKVIIAPDKTLLKGDVIIEDNPNLSKGIDKNPTWKHVLFTAPHNRHVENVGEWRMNSWEEIDKLKAYIREIQDSKKLN